MSSGLYGDPSQNTPIQNDGINVTQYGWTDKEVQGVTLIMDYLKQAQDLYEQSKVLETSVKDLILQLADLKALSDDIRVMYDDFILKYPKLQETLDTVHQQVLYIEGIAKTVEDDKNEVTRLHAAVVQIKSSVEQTYAAIQVILADVTAKAQQVSSDKTTVAANLVEVTRLYNECKNLVEELRAGQVYRGTWNPNSGAWPPHLGTNSVWDVVLNTGQTEVTWNGIKWIWGDRLLYLTSTSSYEQVESGVGVLSVNGKAGFVTLVPSDIGALADGATAIAATRLATARTIGGVSFDGTANINLPGVNAAGTQNTSGNAATASKLATARTIAGVSFDGTANITLNASNVGAIPSTGGTATGNITAPDFIQSAVQSTNVAACTRKDYVDGLLATKVDKTLTINTKPLSANVTLTASDVGALSITGGTLTGSLVINTPGGYGHRIATSADYAFYQGGKVDGDTADQKIAFSGYSGTRLTSVRFWMADSVSPTVRWVNTDYQIYHEGYKPSTSDIIGLNEALMAANGKIAELEKWPQSGSNANGSWVKHKDGTLECYYNDSLSYGTWAAYGSSLFQSVAVWNFPERFISQPTCYVGQVAIPSYAPWATITGTPSTTSASVRVFDVAARATGNYVTQVRAIGRWK